MSTYTQVFWMYNILNGITLTLAFWGNSITKPKTVYSTITENKTWEEAENYCGTHFNQGRLVHIKQYNVNDMFDGLTEGPYWIGLKSKNKQWSWNNDELFVDGTYGWSKVTENLNSECDGCIAYVSPDRWRIYTCNSSKHFICQHTYISLNSTIEPTSSSISTLGLTTVQKMNTMSPRSAGQEVTTTTMKQQSSIKFSQNSNTHLARNITGSHLTNQGTQPKMTSIQTLTETSTSSLSFTVDTLKTTMQTSKKQLASSITATFVNNNTNILDTKTSSSLKFVQRSKPSTDRTSNVTTNRVSSAANSAQSVKGTKTLGARLKTSRKTVQTTKIRAAVTEAPTDTKQDADLVLILFLVLTLPLFFLCCITLLYCLLRTRNRRRLSKKNDRRNIPRNAKEPFKFDDFDKKQSNRTWITHWLADTNSSFQSDPSNISLPPDFATALKNSKEAYDIPRASLHGRTDNLSFHSESSRTTIEPTADYLDQYVHRQRLNQTTGSTVCIPLRDYPR